MTIHACVAAARDRLRTAGLSPLEADLSARLLAEHVLGWETATYLSSANEAEPSGFSDTYDRLVARRAAREPLPYITGRRDFWDLTFEVSPAVLIPRPETELIVEAALEALPDKTAASDVIDVCTGSGVLAVALAKERPGARIMASDISAEALDVARRNAATHGVSERVVFACGDLLDPMTERVDLIVCNPPYVVDSCRPSLQPEVRDHEPAVALFGGGDGLGVLTRLIVGAPGRLRRGGHLIFEFGLGQDVEIEALVRAQPDLEWIGFRHDFQGIARTCVARRT